MAKEYWGGSDPLLARIVIGKGMMKEFANEPARQIVGIVGDVRSEKLNADPLPAMYVPQAQVADAENAWLGRNGPTAWVVRTRTQPHGLARAIREQLREATGLPVSDVHTMDELVSLSTGKQRFNMLLMFSDAALWRWLRSESMDWWRIRWSSGRRRSEFGWR